MPIENEEPTKPPASKGASQARPRTPVIELSDLLGDAREAILVHAGQHYRLRVTASGKLILTK